jgi:Restriction endonuclease
MESTSLQPSETPSADSEDNLRIDPEQVARSKDEWLLKRREYRRLTWKRRASRIRIEFRRLQLFFVSRIQRIHNVIRRDSRTMSDKILVSVAFGLFTGCILLAIYLFCTRIMTSAGLLLGLTTILVSLYAVFFVSDRSIQSQITTCHNESDKLLRYLSESAPTRDQARLELVEARKKFVLLRDEFRRTPLPTTDRSAQREIPFDEFVKDTFLALDYRAVMPKARGDQRIDLLIEKNGVRTAVQVDGNTETVGKNSVQQARAGMNFYACDRCAIVTKGGFTPSAIEFAKKNDCALVSGAQIADLVAGKIPFDCKS